MEENEGMDMVIIMEIRHRVQGEYNMGKLAEGQWSVR